MKKILPVILIMISLILIIVLGLCFVLIPAKRNTGSGYDDNRESSWSLKNGEEKDYATIKAPDGFQLDGQSYYGCSITDEKGNVIADIKGYDGVSRKDAAKEIIKEYETLEKEKGYSHTTDNPTIAEQDTYLITVSDPKKEQTKICVIGTDNNAVSIRISDKNLGENDFDTLIEKFVKRIKVK